MPGNCNCLGTLKEYVDILFISLVHSIYLISSSVIYSLPGHQDMMVKTVPTLGI